MRIRPGIRPFGTSSLWASALLTAVIGIVSLFILRPGYWINDDLKIIWNMAGYPGSAEPIPFMIYSNVILGLVLAPLYGMGSLVNWEVILLVGVNLCSIWALLYVVLSARLSRTYKLAALIVVVSGIASLTVNITYTITAVLACLSGNCMLLTAARFGTAHWKWKALGGLALVLIGTLIRIQMAALVLAFVLPGLAFVGRSLNARRLFVGFFVTVVVVAAGYATDRLYVRSSADWNAYYAYNLVRQKLHDSHRLFNLHNQIRRVGWTGNDQELFARWFFPDKSIYSLNHIQYLVDHTPGASLDLSATARAFIGTLALPRTQPYLLFMLATALWILSGHLSGKAALALLFVWTAALATNLFLAWAYKDPDYVLLSTLAGSITYGLMLPTWREDLASGAGLPATPSGAQRAAIAGSIFLFAAGAALNVGQALATSYENVPKQATYQRILADLHDLQLSGKIAANALLISPAHGLPYEWSYPFKLELPSIDYLDIGWITFSPSYERVLRAFEVDSLPEALYRHNNLYMISESGFMEFLRRYYQEHESVNVSFERIYSLPNPYHFAGYDGIWLYRVMRSP